MIIGFASSLVAAPTEDVNAKIVLISYISCNPSQRIYFKVVPLEEYPNSTITILSITSVTPSNLTTVVLSENPDEFSIQAAGLKNYKIEGTIKVEFNNESIELPFQSALRLEGYSVNLNNTTTTYSSTSEVKTIAVTNPILGLTYEWYDYDLSTYLNSATASPMANPYMIGGPGGIAVPRGPVATGTSYLAPYNNGENLYVIGVTQNGCISGLVTAYKAYEPPFEVVSGKFTLKQVCGDKLVNIVIPARNDNDESSNGLTWKWYNFGSEEQLQNENMPLNLNPLQDKRYVVQVFDNVTNETETFVFLLWGSQPKYNGSIIPSTGLIDWLNINWGFREELVVVKQLDTESKNWNQKQSLLPTDYSYRFCKLRIAPNTKILVMSGPMAFNRLQFLADNEINIEKGVKFTSGCNMWGGLVIQHKSLLNVVGSKEKPVIFENGNFGILLDNPYCCADGMVWGNNYPFLSGSLTSPYRYTVGDEFLSTVKLQYVDFKNNYFHLYLAQEVKQNLSFLKNSNFTCDPDKMLFPYNPKPSSKGFDKTMTEACIVGYDAWKTNFNPSDQLGFFHNEEVGIDISGCEFSDAFYGIVSSYGSLIQKNTFNRIRKISIAMLHDRLGKTEFRVNNQEINMEQYYNSDDLDYSFQNQRENLETYWNNINGYTGRQISSYSNFDEIPSNKLTRNGYSIGMLDDNEPNTIAGDLPKNLTIGIYSTNTILDLNFGCQSVMNLENNKITSVNENLPSQNNRLVGAYIGSLGKLNFNEFNHLYEGVYCNYGCNTSEGLVITGNRFENLVSGVRFTAGIPTTVPEPGLVMSCNTFDFDRSLGNYARTGITFEGKGNVQRVIGGNFVTGTTSLEVPAGNSFPVHNRPDRSNLVYNDDNDEVDVQNSGTLPNVADRWLSPPNWTSIKNVTLDIFNGTPYQLNYYRFSNEFVGSILPDNNFLRVLGPNPATRKYAITSGNTNVTTDPTKTTTICSNINITPVVVFPATGNLTRKNDKNPERMINVVNNGVSTLLVTTSDNQEISNYTLFTVSGQRILQSQASAKSITLPTTGLAKGVYMLHLATHSGTLVSKIIVQ